MPSFCKGLKNNKHCTSSYIQLYTELFFPVIGFHWEEDWERNPLISANIAGT